MKFEIVDVSDWLVMSQEPGGAEPKDWIARPSDVKRSELDRFWLYKAAKVGELSKYRRHDDVAELLASALAEAIGLPAAKVELACRHDTEGIISRNITPPGWELHSGDVRLSECPGYETCSLDERPKNRVGHNLVNIGEVLRGCGGPATLANEPAFSVFAGYLVFDAWIANTDRHAINWAVLERDGERRLAPTFDHGSALASGLREDDLSRHNPVTFARRGMARCFENGRRLPLVDLALKAVDLGGTQARTWLDRIASFAPARVGELLDAAEATMRLSVARRTFLETVLQENQRRLTA
ncbi:HipA domain-containing protein [Actinophytocola gossypii]|uniref:HipA domain-containing protein n=1 Tax=Actinophytocola gossypii TaxID=2812003 RepID=A0ABT2JIW2_9PSEU|nr:HipA domain-containing protein [Actinophytocola gossypii]MCT2587464.1 HipA domain-containing protein [Actinophytocola gossypii]